ncbi:MAG: MBL fold metallo-hydrolase [Candidatus Bilamarchaeaceae archaeon]
MDDVLAIKSTSGNGFRKKHGITANCYLLGKIAIDAPDGIDAGLVAGARKLIITHEHCDHFAGIALFKDCEKMAGAYARKTIEGKRDETCLCSYLSIPFPDVKLDRTLKEGDNVGDGGFMLEVIETPGHSKGAICLYEPEKRFLFSGDTVFPDNGLPNTQLPGSEPKKLIKSYEKLAELGIRRIFPGHGEPVEDAEGYIGELIGILEAEGD